MKTITPSKARNGSHPKIKEAVEKTLADKLREDQQKRATDCKSDLAEVLKKHNCDLRVIQVITIGGQQILQPVSMAPFQLGIDVFANPPQ